MRARELLDDAEATLLESEAIDHWQKGRERIEAEELLGHVLGSEVDEDAEVSAAVRRRFARTLVRRSAGDPVSYITRRAEFHGLDLEIRPGVFIPRAYTEFLADQAIVRLQRRSAPVHVDLATGSGAVALAVAARVPKARVVGTDLAADAVAVAHRNARRLGLANARFVRGGLFSGVPKSLRGSVDTITFHPPFIPMSELADLPAEVAKFEPIHTLTDGSDDGLGLVRQATAESHLWLRPGGWLLIEVSPDRSRTVATGMRRSGLVEVRSTRGEWNNSRVLVGRRPR